MATHSSVLAWRIPGIGEPGGLPSMGSHRVRHDWSDLQQQQQTTAAASNLVFLSPATATFSVACKFHVIWQSWSFSLYLLPFLCLLHSDLLNVLQTDEAYSTLGPLHFVFLLLGMLFLWLTPSYHWGLSSHVTFLELIFLTTLSKPALRITILPLYPLASCFVLFFITHCLGLTCLMSFLSY